ncbi:MAG: hypothetical protein GTN59_06760 [Candidatus Dadabacteria bacterium]|nr:hypothetical protein [Candidatus Dadabacteria bacterium]
MNYFNSLFNTIIKSNIDLYPAIETTNRNYEIEISEKFEDKGFDEDIN